MSNKYTGEVEITMGGEDYILALDWKAMSKIYSDDACGPHALRNLFMLSPDSLAKVTAYALERNHPEMTADKVMELSPPMNLVLEKLGRAVLFALKGTDEEVNDEPDSKASVTESKKN